MSSNLIKSYNKYSLSAPTGALYLTMHHYWSSLHERPLIETTQNTSETTGENTRQTTQRKQERIRKNMRENTRENTMENTTENYGDRWFGI